MCIPIKALPCWMPLYFLLSCLRMPCIPPAGVIAPQQAPLWSVLCHASLFSFKSLAPWRLLLSFQAGFQADLCVCIALLPGHGGHDINNWSLLTHSWQIWSSTATDVCLQLGMDSA